MATTFAVPDGRVAMAATLWTGTGTSSARSVTGVGFQPDFVWGKARSVAYNHQLYDVVRGTGKLLNSNTTDPEQTNFTYGYLSSFDANGFSTTPGATDNENWNQTSATYVAWSWKAGTSTVTNGVGTISSQVNANTTAGFSVVTYTGNGVNSTMGHGLGVAPAMIFYKSRSNAEGWPVYHSSLAVANNLALSNANAQQPNGNIYWNSTAPTATLIRAGTDTANNGLGYTYVAYCWAPVAGYSAFGSYTGNGSADGPFIYTGFRPRWIMVKATTAATAYSWVVLDSSRNTYNLADFKLLPNSSVVENDAGAIGGAGVNAFDLVSNGFKSRTSNLSTNDSGVTYIYAAFAENPLKFSNAR